MKKIIPFLLVFAWACSAWGQAPDFAWARIAGNTGVTVGSLLTLDAAGNSYVVGAFSTSLTLGNTTLIHSGNGGASQFIAKYDPSGQVIWAKKINMVGAQDAANPDKIVADKDGNVYLTGTFISGQQVDAITVPNVPQGKGYGLVKFGPDGTALWFRMANTPDVRIGTSSALQWDPQGNLCLTGLFHTSITFPSGHSFNSSDTTVVSAFRVTYSVDGQWVDGVNLGSIGPAYNPNQNYPVELFKLDAQGLLYRYAVSNRKLAKYDSQNNLLLTKSISAGGTSFELNCFAVDEDGNAFFGGWFYNGNLTLEGNSITKFGNASYFDALLFKLSAADGYSLEWFENQQYIHNDTYSQIRTDGLGNVYVAGLYSPAVGDANSRVAKYTNDGDLLWAQTVIPGSGGTGAPAAMVVVQNIVQAQNGGNVLMMGYFRERIFFNAANAYINPAGVYKVFIAQYGTCSVPVPVLEASALRFCPGEEVTLSASGANGLVWSTGESGNSIYVSEPGSYYVTAVQDSECYSRSPAVWIDESTLPQIVVTQSGASLSVTNSGDDIQWLDCAANFAPIPGADGAGFNPSQNGFYAVMVRNADGCADTSACFEINTLGLGQNDSLVQSVLYPNPAQQLLYTTAEDVTGATIYNVLGQKIVTFSFAAPWDISSLPSGTYWVEWQTPNNTGRHMLFKR